MQMDLSPENILLIGSLLLLISIVAGNVSSRFGVPYPNFIFDRRCACQI